MSKIFIIFLIFALPSSAPSPVYNGALSFHYLLRIGEMAGSFRRVYVRALSKIQSRSVLESYRVLIRSLDWLTGKYRVNGKIRKNKKIEERLFLQNSTLSKKTKKKMNELYQIRQRLALYSSMARAIFCPFATSGFFVTTSLE